MVDEHLGVGGGVGGGGEICQKRRMEVQAELGNPSRSIASWPLEPFPTISVA
jgi:hypothetical protein